MIFEIFVLALASTIRPTSLAAVYALLTPDSRRGLMFAYVVTGLAFTIGFGLVIIYAVHGVHIHSGSSQTKAIADIIGGALVLLLGIAILSGRIRGRRTREPSDEPSRWSISGRRLTLRTAAVAGPLTHIPGLFYLIALNVIVAHNPGVAAGLLSVLIYNVIWFALPIFALVVCILRPSRAQAAVGGVEQWARDHSRPILLVVTFGVGTALLVRGLLNA
jgi:hypothetical protein